jgi:hypothetical protein
LPFTKGHKIELASSTVDIFFYKVSIVTNYQSKMSLFRFFSVALAVKAASAMDFATNGAQALETAYMDDCHKDQTPHGYYGAFLQPCEFIFRQVDQERLIPLLQDDAVPDMCSDKASVVVGKPVPMNWFFNLTEHFDKDDWDEMSSDTDIADITDKLMLWPDQCVGITPRCYSVQDPAIHDTLYKLFEEIPEGATHVQVNCQSDAMELSRVVYAFADGFEKSMPTIIAWMTTVILFSLVASLWCCYGCFRLCRGGPRNITAPVHGHYVSITDGGSDLEKAKLIQE